MTSAQVIAWKAAEKVMEKLWKITQAKIINGLYSDIWHYHLQVQANPPKKLHKKTDAIFSIYGKNGIMPWHFF